MDMALDVAAQVVARRVELRSGHIENVVALAHVDLVDRLRWRGDVPRTPRRRAGHYRYLAPCRDLVANFSEGQLGDGVGPGVAGTGLWALPRRSARLHLVRRRLHE